jgi:hypothetical protein
MDTKTDESFEALLRYMRDSRGFDFTGYERTTLNRRARHRMAQAGYDTFEEYLDVLQAGSDEFDALFNTILINVTAFFRDPDAWEYIATDVIPRLLAERGPDAPIRIWSAGCASGQDAFTLVMLLAETLGPDAFRQRVKIYATDVDEDALTEARAATYDAEAIESVPTELMDKYFEQQKRPLHLSQRPAPRGDLRPQRFGQGCADLPGRSAGVPQHPDVHERRNSAKCSGTLEFSAGSPRHAFPWPRRDAAEPHRSVHPVEPQTTESFAKRRDRTAAWSVTIWPRRCMSDTAICPA